MLKWVAQIPAGKVATYGQIAALSGHPRAARQVGRILNTSSPPDLPWQRVINAQGKISTYSQFGDLQIQLLQAEGVRFSPDGSCELTTYLWQPEL
mgnify:CR=1 FL=1